MALHNIFTRVVLCRLSPFAKAAPRRSNFYSHKLCAPRRGVIVSKIVSLEQLQMIGEFDPHWAPHIFDLVPHLCYAQKIIIHTRLLAMWHAAFPSLGLNMSHNVYVFPAHLPHSVSKVFPLSFPDFQYTFSFSCYLLVRSFRNAKSPQ